MKSLHKSFKYIPTCERESKNPCVFELTPLTYRDYMETYSDCRSVLIRNIVSIKGFYLNGKEEKDVVRVVDTLPIDIAFEVIRGMEQKPSGLLDRVFGRYRKT